MVGAGATTEHRSHGPGRPNVKRNDGEVEVLWLAGWRSARGVAAVVAWACGLGSVSALFLLVVFLVLGPAIGDVRSALPWALALGLVVGGGLGLVAFLVWLPWSRGRPGIVLDETTLTLHHPGLGAPLVVHRHHLAGVVFEPLGDDAPLLALWGRVTPPNVGLLFAVPVSTVPPSAAVRIGQYFHRLWCGGDVVTAVQCRVEDEPAARRAFEQWL